MQIQELEDLKYILKSEINEEGDDDKKTKLKNELKEVETQINSKKVLLG